MSLQYVAGFGKTNIDLIYSDIPRLPKEGEEIYARKFFVQLGGGVPATLINLSRLGIPTKILTSLGDDIFSDFAAREFSRYSVQPTLLPTMSFFPLNVSTAMLTEKERTFISYSDSDSGAFLDEEVIYQSLKNSLFIIMQPSHPQVYKRLKEDGSVLFLDMGWDDEMSFAKYEPYLELADYFTPNAKEAMKITNTKSPRDAAHVLSSYFRNVIVKLDKDGCLLVEDGQVVHVPKIDEFVHKDSTGAGDAFLSGFIYAIYHGYPLRKAVLFGNITGGKCITDYGCLSAYCTEPELLEYAREYARLIS